MSHLYFTHLYIHLSRDFSLIYSEEQQENIQELKENEFHSNLQLFTTVKFSIQCEPHESNRCLRHFSHELVPPVVYYAAVYNLDTSCKSILTLP